MSRERKGKLGGIAGLVATVATVATLAGCSFHKPYAYIRIDTSAAESGVVQPRTEILPPRPSPQPMIQRQCHTHARSPEASMDPRVPGNTVCTCYDPNAPRGHQHYEC